jgi:predicted RND superfamily exporter protein
MAISVIGGLITATLLTLLVIPVVFTYIDDFQNWLMRVLPSSLGGNRGYQSGQANANQKDAEKHTVG